MEKQTMHRSWRVAVDLWIARFGSVFAWFWLVLWGLLGITGLAELIAGEAKNSTDVVLPFILLGVAALHWLVVAACRKTKDLELDFHQYCAFFSRNPDKSIPELAKAIKEPENTVQRQLKEMCRRGYFNGYIDHRTQRMVFPHYRPPVDPEKPDLNVLQCPGCGAVNAIAKTGDICKYCGAPLELSTDKS